MNKNLIKCECNKKWGERKKKKPRQILFFSLRSHPSWIFNSLHCLISILRQSVLVWCDDAAANFLFCFFYSLNLVVVATWDLNFSPLFASNLCTSIKMKFSFRFVCVSIFSLPCIAMTLLTKIPINTTGKHLPRHAIVLWDDRVRWPNLADAIVAVFHLYGVQHQMVFVFHASMGFLTMPYHSTISVRVQSAIQTHSVTGNWKYPCKLIEKKKKKFQK